MARYVELYGVDLASIDWRSSPMSAGDVTGLAPAIVHTAGFDPLRDEGVAYGRSLREANVLAVARNWPTLNHGFFGLGGVSATAERAAMMAVHDLVDLLRA
jgi:acetyl esterase